VVTRVVRSQPAAFDGSRRRGVSAGTIITSALLYTSVRTTAAHATTSPAPVPDRFSSFQPSESTESSAARALKTTRQQIISAGKVHTSARLLFVLINATDYTASSPARCDAVTTTNISRAVLVNKSRPRVFIVRGGRRSVWPPCRACHPHTVDRVVASVVFTVTVCFELLVENY